MTWTMIQGCKSTIKEMLMWQLSHIFNHFPGILMRLVGMLNLLLILSYPFNIQEGEPYLCDFIFVKKK